MLHNDLKAVKFYPYTSRVKQRIFRQENYDDYRRLKRELLQLFSDSGVKAWDDNKTVFECSLNGTTIFYGFYDLNLSIGLAVESEHA